MHIVVHPLVVMSIADHYTRENVQSGRERVIGTLFGTQNGRVSAIKPNHSKRTFVGLLAIRQSASPAGPNQTCQLRPFHP